ncbi:lipoprotein [Spiroplasma alleghenense]|uniref:Lipoprotein n=1 Tax=Spiroplasma alleghenense TaxID=216931 RepID=A0A345Z592_9MOLU|nr:lipoprotein [Spiroplasma alleghenense]AXK51771.1 hypothetical protein SALLE_v1c11010 [Spiroplasma alleghenense]
MKKLLSILAASTLIVSTPLSVVACGKTKDEVDGEFDFVYLQKELRNSVQEIFNANLKKDFDDYLFVSESNGNEKVDYPFGDKGIEWFIEFQEKLGDKESLEYIEVRKDISQIIRWENVESEISQKILTNINYKPILVDNKTPLRDGYEIKDMSFKTNGSDSFVVNIEIGANFYYLDETGQMVNDNLNNYKTSINIMKNSEDEVILNETKDTYVDEINSVENANSFLIESDTGRLEKTAALIDNKNDSNPIFKQLDSIIDSIDSSLEGVTINKDYKINTNKENIVDASLSEQRPKYKIGVSQYGSTYFTKALEGKPGAEQEFIDLCSMNKSKVLENTTRNRIENIEELAAKHGDFAEVINSYNLEYNLRYSSAGKLFESSLKRNNFKLNPEEDRSYIALFRASIENVSFTYNESVYELPTEQIVIKQRPKIGNSKDLYAKFISDAFYFNKLLFGFEEGWSLTDNPDYKYYLKKPESWKDIEPRTVMSAPDAMDDLVAANREAAAFLEPLDLHVAADNNSYGINYATEASFNEDGELYFWDSANNVKNLNSIKVSFYSPEFIEIRQGKLFFGFNVRGDVSTYTTPYETPTKWILK